MTDDKADEEAQTDLDGAISVVSIDENGNEVQESSIAEAIDAASEGTPESAVSVQSADETLLTAKNVVVVLDPGHGGSDSGTRSELKDRTVLQGGIRAVLWCDSLYDKDNRYLCESG